MTTRALYLGEFGSALIAAERRRQIEGELFSLDHDQQHTASELLRAAICYAYAGWILADGGSPREIRTSAKIAVLWPWSQAWFKPAEDPLRNLEKAGALIAAEIDRLERLRLNNVEFDAGEGAACGTG